jgi:hypothetical protein
VVKPGIDEAKDVNEVADFIRDVASELSDRATLREQLRFHAYRTQSRRERAIVSRQFPERQAKSQVRALPPAEQRVLISRYEDRYHADWVRSQKLYYLFAWDQSAPGLLDSRFAEILHIVLLENGAVVDWWRVVSPQIQLRTEVQLCAAGYPGTLKAGGIYIGYEMETGIGFAKVAEIVPKVMGKRNGVVFPLIATLEELLGDQWIRLP